MFVDNAVVKVVAGKGGNGIVSFRRERAVAMGGPDGGNGGNGANVVFVASNNENTLANFRFQKELQAENGKNGFSQKMHGRKGEELEIKVPVGTQVTIKGVVVADLTVSGQTEIIAKGGKGGYGNAHFTSSVRQAPKIAEKGEEGEEFIVELELKIIADVGLVGLPNAGKSTLLSRVSSAKPKIANYPFTTLNPHLGVVQVDKGLELLMADIPGLIDGASEGKGLGDDFLRHVERTQVLLHMVDVYSDDIVRDFKTIQKELKNYKIDLSPKPQLVVVTKIEGLDDDIVEDQINTLKKAMKLKKVYAISSLSGSGLKQLLYDLYATVTTERTKQAELVDEQDAIPVIGVREDEDRWTVTQDKTNIFVNGGKIIRFAKRTDFASEDGVRRLRDILRKMGIMRAIEKLDLTDESKIYFGDNREDYIEY
jgi:GTP-binding protein